MSQLRGLSGTRVASGLILQAGQEVYLCSKLNLVDLAGSERVSRTNVDGQILREAKHINLSLHYLEQVILALQVGFLIRCKVHRFLSVLSQDPNHRSPPTLIFPSFQAREAHL